MVRRVRPSHTSADMGPIFIKRFDILLVIQVNPTSHGPGLRRDMNIRR